MTGNQGNTSGDMPGETSKPVSTMSGWNVQKATNVFNQEHHMTIGDVLGRGATGFRGPGAPPYGSLGCQMLVRPPYP